MKQKEASRRAAPDARERIPTGAGGAARTRSNPGALPNRQTVDYSGGVTTVVVVEVGGATGSVTVVVRRTVVVSVVGGGVDTTSSLEHAP